MSFRVGSTLLFGLLLLRGGSAPAEAGTSGPPPAPIIVIDPGHGGDNQGAKGPQGVREKQITLEVASRMAGWLERHTGARAVLTRQEDHHLGLRERIRMANQLGADLFLSVHCNSSPVPGPRGFETFYLSDKGAKEPLHRASSVEVVADSPDLAVRSIVAQLASEVARQGGARLASSVRGGLKKAVSSPDRGVKRGAYTVLVGASVPAAVVELGFLNHPGEGVDLADPGHQTRLVNGLLDGLLDYLDKTGRLPKRLTI